MKKKDNIRKWMYLLLVAIAAFQLYFVRELLAAFALFILAFACFALLLAAFYLVQKTWEAGVRRLALSQNRLVLAARRSVGLVEDWTRRPFRRPDSEPAR